MKSKYKLGWICLRATRIGSAARLLKRAGWWKMGHAEMNNRNGFDWVIPCRTESEFNSMDWVPFASRGLMAVAMWITDAQWKDSLAVTDTQWENRKFIDPK
jgi:hypothetical protein